MNRIFRQRWLAPLLLAAACLGGPAGAADAYPAKPITLVIPFPPGGSNDLFARYISKDLGELLKQAIVVDNRPGAGGNMGATVVARAPADGYTLLLVSSTFVTNAVIQPKGPYDIVKSFEPVGLLARGPLIVAVNNQFPVSNPQELIAHIRKNPGKFNYASSGPGSLSQFSTELLKAQAGQLDITHVPYRGGGPALNELIGDQTQVYIASAPALLPMIRNGKIKGVAVTSLKPSAVAPGMATVSSAVPGYEYESWWGVLAPAGTPPAIVQQLNLALNQVIQSASVKQNFFKEGAESAPGTPGAFAKVIVSDYERLKVIARQQKIVAE